MTSTAHGLPLSPHPGAPPPGIAYPYTPPQALQPPGLPHPPFQIHPQGGSMPRGSSHGKSGHPDDESPGTISSGTQATWNSLQQSAFSGGGRHSQDSPCSRQSSGSRQAVEPPYSRQSLDHPFSDFRHGLDHPERPSARKSHRQPRDFPFLQEFEPTYNGQKEKRFSSSSSSSSSSGQRHDKESAYGSQRLGSDKTSLSKYQVKDVSHRIQFENLEPTYQKQRRELQSYCDQRQDRDPPYINRRAERDQAYDCQRQEREQRCSSLRHERDSFQTSSRRERDSGYTVQRPDPTRRSGSADSNHSYESQCTERDTSPHFSPSPSAGYRSQGTQPYGRESRSHSVERDAEFPKHRESGGDRYPPAHAVQANFSRQPAESFPEPASRPAERDTMFEASLYGVESYLQTKNGCSGKAVKSSKSSGNISGFISAGRGGSGVPGQFSQRVSSYPDLVGHEVRVEGRPIDSSWKKTADMQENQSRSGSLDRSACGQSDRDRSSSSRKKQSSSSREPSADAFVPPLVHYSQQSSYLPPSPYPSNGSAANIPSSSILPPTSAQRGQYKTHFSSCDEEYGSFRVPRQQAFASQPPEHRPPRPGRPSPPISPLPSPYPSRPPTPPLYSPRPPSPAPFTPLPPRPVSPSRQQFHKADEGPAGRRSSRQVGGSSQGCNGPVEKKNAQTSPGLPTPQRDQRRSIRADDSPESEEPPPPAEPMAWQQQYLKHLQQQQLQEEQMRGEVLQQEEQQVHQDHAKSQMRREQMEREQVKKTQEQVQREIQQEQMRKQQEQMQREYIKIQQEKMQREHLKQLEQLQREHMIQLEQMRKEHMKQQQELMQRERMKQQEHSLRDNLKQQQERLIREQTKQQEKMRREQLKQQEQMQREHTKLQQEHLQGEQLKIQEQMRCAQQERTQRELVQQELMQKQKQQHQHKAPEDGEQVQVYPRQLPDFIQHRYEQIQQQQQQELRLQHEQFHTAQEQQQQQQYHSDPREHQQRFQHQQQPPTTHEQRPQQQQYQHQQPQNLNKPAQQQQQQYQHQMQRQNEHLHRQQQQQIMQYQQQQGHYNLQQQQHHAREYVPVPPWRQSAGGGESCGQIAYQTDSSPVRHESRTMSPARQPSHQSISPAREPNQGFSSATVPHQNITLTTQPHQKLSISPATPHHQLHQSPVRQLQVPHNGNHTFVPSNSTNYAVQRPEQPMPPPASQPNSAVQLHSGFQPQFRPQHHDSLGSQLMVQNNHNFEAYAPPPVSSSSNEQGSKPKKPPWLQDQDSQVLCTQKKPPWQQQTEHVIIVAGQESVVGSTSQFHGAASSATGQQFPVQQQTIGMPEPPTMSGVAVNPLQDQAQLRRPPNIDPLTDGGLQQQNLVNAQRQQNPQHHNPYDSSSHAYSNGLQTRPSVTQAHMQGAVLSSGSVPSGGHQYSKHGADPQRVPSTLAVSGQNHPANVHVVFSHSQAATDPPGSHVYLHQVPVSSNNEVMYPYQTPVGSSGTSAHGDSMTDQEGAQQVLVEALNEQVQQTHLQASSNGNGLGLSQNVQIVDQNNTGVQMLSQDAGLVSSVEVQQQQQPARDAPSLETYTLHHLFDDSNRIQPHAQPLQVLPAQSREGQFQPVQQGHPQQFVIESDHQVVPGNPLDTAVAMLNFPDSALDIPMIEQHQVFVLEPPGSGSHNRQQPPGLTAAPATAVRRNSWHTPENSVAGSRSSSFAEDEGGLVIDLSTDLCEEDDNIFFSQEATPTSTAAHKTPPQESGNFTNTGINDLGLRISSVFSLATTRRGKRRTMSDSVLQEVELVERRQDFLDSSLGDSFLMTNGNSPQHNPSTNLSQMQKMTAVADENSDQDFTFPQDQKSVCARDGLSGFNSSSQDPLAELTKLLFADVSAPSPGTAAAEDWNLQEAAGVSFEADSVCVPGTPARGEPERLATPLPQLFTPKPQVGGPMSLYYKDPGTPFQRHVPVSQYVKNPATPLPACAKETKEQPTSLPATLFANYRSSDVKEPVTSLPHPMKELKESSASVSSCAMGPPPLLPCFAVKAKDPSVPLPQCAKGSSGSLTQVHQASSVASHSDTSGTAEAQPVETVLEIGVEASGHVLSEKVEKASRQPLEQAIRELLGDEPIEKVSEKSFRATNGKSPRRERVKAPAKQPQRKSERISAKETMAADSDLRNEKNSEPAVSEKDIRSRVKDNWERRCISNNANTPKSTRNRSRDSSRESDHDKRCVQMISDTLAGSGGHRNKTPPRSRFATKAEEEEDEEKKSCGVRGRRTMTMAGKRRLVSGRLSSVEDASPDRRLRQATDGSQADKPWLYSMRSLSQDSSDGEGDTKASCNKDSVKNEADTQPAEVVDQGVFFPSLSRSNSTDSSSADDADDACERGKRRRLSSSESKASRLSSRCSCHEDVGENIEDMILPTVFPPSRRRCTKDKATTGYSDPHEHELHEHKLRCVEFEGEHYIVLEEVLAKCFPGLPRAQVERARVRDLNLLTRTVHLLGSGLPGDGGDAVSVLALPDAARLVHFFHGMTHCSGTDCKLRPSSPIDCRGSPDSESSKLQQHSTDKGTVKACVPRSGSLGFKCTGKNAVDGNDVRAVVGRTKAEGSRDDGAEEAATESDMHDDTRSCHSDQTFPYCDGQPMMTWEEESVAKSDNNSDVERALSPSAPSYFVSRKFRRHSSDSEGRVRQPRDKEGLHRAHLPNSPDNFSLGDASPMLPPLLTYVTSPFTPGSMYNVPMDNERVLLECFSAPGSQAPSSVRSAPSVRLLSPDRADPTHCDEDVFEGLPSHKFLSDFDLANAVAESQPKQLVSPYLNGKEPAEEKPEGCLTAERVGCGIRNSAESIDYHDLHCTIDFDAEETDDVFLEVDAHSKEGKHHSKPSDYRLKEEQSRLEKGCYPNESSVADKGYKHTLAQLFEKTLQCQRTEVYTTLPLTTDLTLPSQVGKKQQVHKQEENDKLLPSRERETEKQLARHLDEKLSAIVAGESEAQKCDRDQHENNNDALECASSRKTAKGVAEKDSLDDGYYHAPVDGSARSSLSDDTSLSGSEAVSLNPSSEKERQSSADPTLAIERKCSDATIAYGASDEELDVNSNTGKTNQAWLDSQNSTGPPELSTVRGSVQTNDSPHASPPRIEPVTTQISLIQPPEETLEKRAQRLLEEPQDERRPPEASDGSLEDRVQDFIAHGSQFTPRAMVRSNSLPDLCGAENLPSPVRVCEEGKYFMPGPVTHRSTSYPGASKNSNNKNDISDGVNDGEDSSVPSPAAPLSTTSPYSANKDKEGNSFALADSSRSVKEKNDTSDTKAPDHVPELEDAVFLDPADVVDGGEVCTKATPRRSPQPAGDCGDQLFEWAVPCAAHGSVFCSCEGIDIQEVAASPRVGPWLCTPGTPAPATPFCDYSKLIYSPFPVEAGMTPARPEAADAQAGSPKLPLTPELDAMVCGVKRLASTEGQLSPAEGQSAAKRRPLSSSHHNSDATCSSCDVIVSADASKSDGGVNFHQDESSSFDIPVSADVNKNDGDLNGHQDEISSRDITVSTETSQRDGEVSCHLGDRRGSEGTDGGGRDGVGAEETDKLLLENEELELIAAAEESERNMANLSSEEKMQLASFPLGGHGPTSTASDISGGCLLDTKIACADSDPTPTALQRSNKLQDNTPLTQHDKVEGNAPVNQQDKLADNDALTQGDKVKGNAPVNQHDKHAGNDALNQRDKFEDDAPQNQRDKHLVNAVLHSSDTCLPNAPSHHSTTADFRDFEQNLCTPASSNTNDTLSSPIGLRTNPTADCTTSDNQAADSITTAINSADMGMVGSLAKTAAEISESSVHGEISQAIENLQTKCSKTENLEKTEETPGDAGTAFNTKLVPDTTIPCDFSVTKEVPNTAIPNDISDTKPVPDSTILYDISDDKVVPDTTSPCGISDTIPVSGTMGSCGIPDTKVAPDTTIPDDISQVRLVPDSTMSPNDFSEIKVVPDRTISAYDVSNTKVVPDRTMSPYDVSDTTSVGTVDSESVPDVRIIALGDFLESDMDLTSPESDDSGDCTEVKQSLKVPDSKLKQSAPENKKTLTLAQYRERHKNRANSRDSTSSSEVCKASKSEFGTTETPGASDTETERSRQEKEKSKVVDNPTHGMSSPMSPLLTSRDCVMSSKPGVTSGEHVPKMQRTESVPAEPSRKVAVQRKRSASFHGHLSASKRFKHERGQYQSAAAVVRAGRRGGGVTACC